MRIAALVSGGVDSSVALARMVAEGGHDVHAFYLKIWLEDELSYLGACPWEEDLAYARDVCDQLGVPLEVVPLQRAYHARVVRHAVSELAAGRTPSPDVHCNEHIKFGAFWDALADRGFDAIASGHYARVTRDGDRPALRMAPDPIKDQTYFLSRLTAAQLLRLRLPIGRMTKAEVRREAHARRLATRDRPDSQGICFLGKLPYPEFVRAYLGDRPGPIVDDATGRTLGAHRGLWFHTIGQRRGLGLGGGPWFVVGKEPDTDTLRVAQPERVETQARRRFEVRDLRWIGRPAPSGVWLGVKLRHGPLRLAGICRPLDGDGGRAEVTLSAPDAGIAPGQFAVFYRRDVCLGQGVIAD